METEHDQIRHRLYARLGFDSRKAERKFITLADLEREVDERVWCPEFFVYMRNRLLMGTLRYGPKKAGAPKYDYAGAIEGKIALYKTTGNTELLVDIGNYAMLEFKFGEHPNKHFAAGDDTEHCKIVK